MTSYTFLNVSNLENACLSIVSTIFCWRTKPSKPSNAWSL